MTNKDRSILQNLCTMTEAQLRAFLIKLLKRNHYNPIVTANYIIAEGDNPICLIAHTDTVFKYRPEEFLYDQKRDVLWGVGGSGFDDRAGVFAIVKILQNSWHPSIIFTTDEEVGCLGSRHLIQDIPRCPFKDCRALIQLDRANAKDCVFYDCDNPEFEQYISNFGFEFASGTFTDISWIAPAWGIAAVNLSVGYIDEHTSCERIYLNWLESTIKKVNSILKYSAEMPGFIYIEEKKPYHKYFDLFSDDDEYKVPSCAFCGRPFSKTLTKHTIQGEGYSYNICKECKELYDL